ncbi:UNVERIFIED_CONTAM: hypothetical protein PYX00_005899 [Menopon gallinae]|uniref:Gustatory receptor n=1 Tax=Menopon gallinae TaxID=328185 RepID=A0AAW2HTU1_9NEOP
MDVYGLIRASTYLQYFGLSIPIYTIDNNGNLVMRKRMTRAEIAIVVTILVMEGTLTFQNRSKLSLTIIGILSIMSQILNTTLSLVTVLVVQRKFRLTKTIFDSLKTLNSVITLQKNQVKTMKLHLSLWAFVVLVIAFIISAMMTLYNTINEQILATLVTLRLYLQPIAVLIQFLTLATLIQFYLEWVNKQLASVKPHEPEYNRPFITVRRHAGESDGCKTVHKIERLRQIYGQIQDLKTNLNRIYSPMLWLDITVTFFQILLFLFVNLVEVQSLGEGANTPGFHYRGFWVTFLVLKLVDVVRICGRVAEAGKEIGTTVHRVFSSSFCERVRSELTAFSLELLHRDPYFNAFKLITIDYSLTSSLLRGVIMQLIALMQINLPAVKDVKDLLEILGAPTNPTGNPITNSSDNFSTFNR